MTKKSSKGAQKNKKRYKFARRRQWGTERLTDPLSHLHNQPSSLMIAFSRFAVVLTVIFWVMYVISVIFRQLIEGPGSYAFTIDVFGYLVVVTFLTFSALMYLVTRQGAMRRFAKHVRTPRSVIDHHFSESDSSITVLIPSYAEETNVIRKTMLSAALQEYPALRVVLLVDDHPFKVKESDIPRLTATRALATEIQDELSEPLARFQAALEKFESVTLKKQKASESEVLEIAAQYNWAAEWLTKFAEAEVVEDHVDVFFAEQVIGELANDLRLVDKALVTLHQEGAGLSLERMHQLYRRLVWIFNAELEVFERKRYASLSHEPNKAMNLNSYIGLMGHSYHKEETPDGIALMPVTDEKLADVVIPDSEYLLTLDADSVLLREYCLRLVYFLEQPDNADVGVVQTPYSSFRGAGSRIERLSGATTDIQHILHQGMSHYNATFWVGANAVIRKKAIEDIVEKEWVGGFEIKRYVQDRTVIEDTESSIDLALHGWRLVNYPERLSYSATPPDFGSLVIQRRRWANGGLLILPKLFRLVAERRRMGKPVSKTEFMIRLNYMASIAWSNIGLIFLLAYPYDGRLLSPFVLLAAAPYFLSMAIDLRYCRYRYSDIIRIYGFNLILLPVNIAGTLKSLEQALTTKKTAFARTPKVKNRTAAGLPYVISPLLIVAFSIFTLYRNIMGENWGNAAFAGFNAFASIWAILSYIGVRNLLVDVWMGLTDMLYVDVDSKKKTVEENADFNWQGVLYHGENNPAVPHQALKNSVLHKN
jgi:cellulose synthase/poly-beta-1,6-N-acetylglucosamine synthase-like glycosyltransferase